MAYTEEDCADEGLRRRSGINRLKFEARILAGSWGADFTPDLQPAESEVILKHHKATNVFETDLPQHLDDSAPSNSSSPGWGPPTCAVSPPGRHGTKHGYQATFLSDAIGAESLPAEASIHIDYPLIANAVMEVDEFLAALSTSAESPRSATPSSAPTAARSVRSRRWSPQTGRAGPPAGHLRVPRGVILEYRSHAPTGLRS